MTRVYHRSDDGFPSAPALGDRQQPSAMGGWLIASVLLPVGLGVALLPIGFGLGTLCTDIAGNRRSLRGTLQHRRPRDQTRTVPASSDLACRHDRRLEVSAIIVDDTTVPRGFPRRLYRLCGPGRFLLTHERDDRSADLAFARRRLRSRMWRTQQHRISSVQSEASCCTT